MAAVVPIADLELSQALEDRIDVHEARAALHEAQATATKPLNRPTVEPDDPAAH